MRPSTTTIAIVTSADWFFWSHRLPVARAARDAGYEVLVIAPEERGFGPRIRAEGMRFIDIPLERGSMRIGDELLTIRALHRVYRAERPDLVHHISLKPVIHGSIAARLAGVPAIINALAGQGYPAQAPGLKGRLLRATIRGACRLAYGRRGTRAIFQNPDDLEDFVGAGIVARESSVLIRGSGVDLDLFRATPEPAGLPVVLFASRLLKSKGVNLLVDAVRELRRGGAQLRLVIVGVPDLHNPDAVAEQQLRDWVAEGAIEWWGLRDDMQEVLAQATVVALPTRYGEGVPKVLIEAAAVGRAIVATDVPGCREIVRDGVNGRLVPPGDQGALVAALGELLADAALRARMGAAGRALAVAEFSERSVVERTLAVYEAVLAVRGVSR